MPSAHALMSAQLRYIATALLSCLPLAVPIAAHANPLSAAVGQLRLVIGLLDGSVRTRFRPEFPEQFEVLAADLAAASAPRFLDGLPASGAWHISAQIDRSTTADPSLWELATGDPESDIKVPRLRVMYGLTEGVAAGIGYTQIPGRDERLWNAEVSARLYRDPGDREWIVRVSHGRLRGIRDLDARASTVEALVRADWRWMQPYVGAGGVHSDARLAEDFDYRADQWLGKVFGGVGARWGPARFAVEIGSIDGRAYQSGSVGFEF